MINFSVYEIEIMMKNNPDILRALANEHDCKVVEGEAMGFNCGGNVKRSKELNVEADRIESEY